MYFMTRGGSVCHVLHDERTGAAPCGAKPEKLELISYRDGKPSPHHVGPTPVERYLRLRQFKGWTPRNGVLICDPMVRR